MRVFVRGIFLFMLSGVMLTLQSCNYVNDYWLGKDNTPKPTELAPIQAKVQITPNWNAALGKMKAKDNYIRLKPAVRGNRIYAATFDGTVKALDKKTGRVIWSRELPAKVLSGPAVREGIVVVSTDRASVIALNQHTGEIKYEAKVSGQVLSTPLITDNHLIIKPVDDRLYAFNATNGTKLWGIDHGSSPLVLGTSSSPVAYHQLILAGFSDGKLDAIDRDTGRVVWQRGMGYISGSSDVDRLVDISTDPLVQGNMVYLASYQGYLVAMSLRQGEIQWSKPTSTYRNLAVDDSQLYMTDTKDILWAFGLENGQVQWKQPALTARGVTGPALMGRYIVVGDKLGVLHVVDAWRGALVGRRTLDSAIIAPPVVDKMDNSRFYVMTAKGQLYSFSLKGITKS